MPAVKASSSKIETALAKAFFAQGLKKGEAVPISSCTSMPIKIPRL